jgi:hypothetical protein
MTEAQSTTVLINMNAELNKTKETHGEQSNQYVNDLNNFFAKSEEHNQKFGSFPKL